jgi:hypothetical protein
MLIRTMFPVLDFRPIRKTILSVLIGLMGGGVAVLAQQPADTSATAPIAAPAAPETPPPPPTPSNEVIDLTPATPATPPSSANEVIDLTPATPATPPSDLTPATSATPAADTTAPPAATPPADATATPATPADAATAAPTPGAAADAPDDLVKAGFTPSTAPIPVVIGKDGTAVEVQMDKATAKKVKKLHDKFKGKEKLPKQTPMDIVQGTLTVDGWTGKARMNYDIADLKYLYVWAPGVGTVVISNGWFEAGEIQLHAFAGNTLTINADGHTIQVTSEKPMLGKKQTSAFVYVDKTYTIPSRFPVMGYGGTDHPPYAWPGAKNVQLAKNAKPANVIPPPLPVDLRPTLAVAGCAPVGSKAALNQTVCTPAMEAARRKQIADAEAAAKKQTTTATDQQPTLQTRPTP